MCIMNKLDSQRCASVLDHVWNDNSLTPKILPVQIHSALLPVLRLLYALLLAACMMIQPPCTPVMTHNGALPRVEVNMLSCSKKLNTCPLKLNSIQCSKSWAAEDPVQFEDF